MGSKENSRRKKWQDVSGLNAGLAEQSFFILFSRHYEGTDFRIRQKPDEFKNIYSKILLHENVLAQIYNPTDQTWVHGIIPDYAIDNTKTGKTLYVEVKRQDGWVETTTRSAGRGNAHERSCKYFTPGLLGLLREQGKIAHDKLPFWVVFQGDIARDPKRVREVTFWFGKEKDHFFMWSDKTQSKPLLDHFDLLLSGILA